MLKNKKQKIANNIKTNSKGFFAYIRNKQRSKDKVIVIVIVIVNCKPFSLLQRIRGKVRSMIKDRRIGTDKF